MASTPKPERLITAEASSLYQVVMELESKKVRAERRVSFIWRVADVPLCALKIKNGHVGIGRGTCDVDPLVIGPHFVADMLGR